MLTTAKARRASWTDQIRHNHYVQQFERFVRLTVVAAVPSVVDLLRGGNFDWKTLLAFILPFAEVAFREIYPTTPPAPVDPPADGEVGVAGVVVLLVILALIFFGLGFVVHWVFVLAVVLAICAVVAALTNR